MNQTTNTNGVIAEATKQKPVKSKPHTPSQLLNSLLNNNAIQQTLQSTLKENSGAFATSVMNLFNNDKLLQQCEPKAVLAEALKAAALKLPVEKQLGFAYIIPFKDHGVPKPQFQLGYKGYIQLAMRTGAYRYINADKVYKGELKSVNKLTGAIDLSGERISDEVIGYFAYIETLNGFNKTLYWTTEQIKAHADKYSKSYKAKNAIWRDNFDEMAIKTVLRNLLSHYGVMTVEMSKAMSDEEIPADDVSDIAPEEISADGEVFDENESESASSELTETSSDDDYPFKE